MCFSADEVCVCVYSLRAADLGVGDGAEERQDFTVVQEESHQRDGRLLLLTTHLAQDMSRGRRDGLRHKHTPNQHGCFLTSIGLVSSRNI